MNEKLSSLIKKIFLTSVASIGANEGMSKDIESYNIPFEKSELRVDLKEIIHKKPKLLLTKSLGNSWELIAHRSHRSHSSHRSHYSGSSSSSRSSTSSSRSSGSGTSSNSSRSLGVTSSPSTSYTPPDYSNNSLQSQLNSSQTNNNSSNSNTLSLTPTNLKLGDRTLKKGISGSDVTELINVLLKKGYVKLENGDMEVTGVHTFDETVEAVMKRFQSNNGLTNDGICGPLTIYYLLNR
jgi:hypothetical protein